MLIFQVRREGLLELEAGIAEIRFEGVKSTAAVSQLIATAQITTDVKKSQKNEIRTK